MELPNNPRDFKTPNYGLTKFGDLFTPRQLVALTTFSDLVPEAIARIRTDAQAAGMPDDGRGLDAGGNGATAYAEAVGVYLAFIVSKLIDVTRCSGSVGHRPRVLGIYLAASIPMVWDFAKATRFLNQLATGPQLH
jgi:putative DNA methylase